MLPSLFTRRFPCPGVIALGFAAALSVTAPARADLPLVTVAVFDGQTTGANPDSNLIIGRHGDLYGTAVNGRTNTTGNPSLGEVYVVRAGSHVVTDLADFTFDISATVPPYGIGPFGDLIADEQGNLYGTTQFGGPSGYGTVFEYRQASGTLADLADLNGPAGDPAGGQILRDWRGDLFGVSSNGGQSGGGLYEVAHGGSTVTVLAAFPTPPNQVSPSPPVPFPILGLAFGSGGSLIGTTGADQTLFSYRNGTLTTLHTFSGEPVGTLTEDIFGDIFGVTADGANSGTIWELRAGSHTVTTLATVSGIPNGGLALDWRGDLFGTTQNGGTAGKGSVFEVTARDHRAKVLASFSGANGASPLAGPVLDERGNLFGTASNGGPNDTATGGDGVIWEIPGAAPVW